MTSVTLEWIGEEYGWTLESASTWLALPLLRAFRGSELLEIDKCHAAPLAAFRDKSSVDASFPRLKKIHLEASVICDEAIGQLVAACKNLEDWYLQVRDIRDRFIREMDVEVMMQAFGPVKRNIRRWVLKWHEYSMYDFCSRRGRADFSNWANLKWLDVPEPIICGLEDSGGVGKGIAERLPPSLEVLVIRDLPDPCLTPVRERHTVTFMMEMLAKRNSRFVNLKSVAVVGEDIGEAATMSLRQICDSQQLEFNNER